MLLYVFVNLHLNMCMILYVSTIKTKIHIVFHTHNLSTTFQYQFSEIIASIHKNESLLNKLQGMLIHRSIRFTHRWYSLWLFSQDNLQCKGVVQK